MEINEGDVRITHVPFITIGDTGLDTLVKDGNTQVIGREFIKLCNTISQQRTEIAALKVSINASK